MSAYSLAKRDISMKKEFGNEMSDELLPEYDFAQMERGISGKYIDRYRAATWH